MFRFGIYLEIRKPFHIDRSLMLAFCFFRKESLFSLIKRFLKMTGTGTGVGFFIGGGKICHLVQVFYSRVAVIWASKVVTYGYKKIHPKRCKTIHGDTLKVACF